MSEIMTFILNNYNYLIQEDNTGKKYVESNSIENLELSPQEKGLIRLTFENFGIEIREQVKEIITKKERSNKVSNYDYGSIKSDEYSSYDKPVIAKIEYDGDELTFENYEELDKFILYEFVPNNVFMKQNKSKNSKSYDYEKPYPSIQLRDIVRLKLSEKEVEHIADLLYKNGIRIGGTSQDMDGEFINYDYIRTYNEKKFEKPLSREEEHEKFLEYYRTHDPLLREELVIRNLRLVPFIAWKYALRHNIDREEIESYGYEGLMYAIEDYNPTMNNRFANYAIPNIEGYIKKCIPKIKNIPNNLYYAFQNACYIIEREWGKKYDGDPLMLDEIIDLMVQNGTIDARASKEIKERFAKPASYEELQENNIDITSINLEDTLEKGLFKNLVANTLKDSLKILTERERDILLWRYGFMDGKCYYLDDIGKMYNISGNRVMQIEKKALRKLKGSKQSKNLHSLWQENSYAATDDMMLYDENEEIKKHY